MNYEVVLKVNIIHEFARFIRKYENYFNFKTCICFLKDKACRMGKSRYEQYEINFIFIIVVK